MIKLAVVGATGLVGRKLLQVIEKRDIHYDELVLFSSKRSAGQELSVKNKPYIVQELTEKRANDHYDYVLMSAGASTSEQYAPLFENSGAIVIDNSSEFRMVDGIDLVVPEVNRPTLKRKIIANPNCSTIQAVVPLKILDEKYGVKRVAYTTYQAVSGSGKAGLEDLENGSKGQKPKTYPHPIYNNVLPHIDVFQEDGYTKEEQKMMNETRKILGKDVNVTATCVRVPVKDGHSVQMSITLETHINEKDIKQLFSDDNRVVLQDDPKNAVYPQSLTSAGRDEVFVGRIREDKSLENTFHVWCSADNLLKGAALNTVQIMEQVMTMNESNEKGRQ